jgi:hypothetical protein
MIRRGVTVAVAAALALALFGFLSSEARAQIAQYAGSKTLGDPSHGRFAWVNSPFGGRSFDHRYNMWIKSFWDRSYSANYQRLVALRGGYFEVEWYNPSDKTWCDRFDAQQISNEFATTFPSARALRPDSECGSGRIRNRTRLKLTSPNRVLMSGGVRHIGYYFTASADHASSAFHEQPEVNVSWQEDRRFGLDRETHLGKNVLCRQGLLWTARSSLPWGLLVHTHPRPSNQCIP